MKKRIFLSIILFLGIFYLPFYIVFTLGVLGLVFFKKYWEFPVIMLFADLFYYTSEARFYGIFIVGFLLSMSMLFLVEFLKNKLKFNQFENNDRSFI
jgi:hypothetical protein